MPENVDFQVLKENEAYFKILTDNEGLVKELSSNMSFKIKDAHFHPKVKMKVWDGRIRLFKYPLLPSGLISRFFNFCARHGYTVQNFFKASKRSLTIEDLKKFYTLINIPENRIPRDDQLELILCALNNRSGVLLSATGGGKSLILYLLCMYYLAATSGKILVIVPRVSLVNQLYSDFLNDYGFNSIEEFVDKMFSGEEQLGRRITIGTWQSLIRKSPKFFEKYTSVIVDECHEAKSESIHQVLSRCINAKDRIGTTATMPSEAPDFFKSVSFLGPVLATVTTKELQEKGVLAQCSIVSLIIEHLQEVRKALAGCSYDDEIQFIENSKDRMVAFDFLFSNVIDPVENTLILVRHLKHLKKLSNYFSKKYPGRKIFIIHGGISPKERESIRSQIESLSGVIILATYATMSVGVNIPKLHHIILGSPYKRDIPVIQALGRGLRLHETKKKLFLWDIVDDLRTTGKLGGEKQNHSWKHFLARRSHFEKQGHIIESHKIRIKDERSTDCND